MGLVNVFQNLVVSYNHSRHRSIGIAPADVQKRGEHRLWVRLYGDGDTHIKDFISQRVMVRVSKNNIIL